MVVVVVVVGGGVVGGRVVGGRVVVVGGGVPGGGGPGGPGGGGPQSQYQAIIHFTLVLLHGSLNQSYIGCATHPGSHVGSGGVGGQLNGGQVVDGGVVVVVVVVVGGGGGRVVVVQHGGIGGYILPVVPGQHGSWYPLQSKQCTGSPY